MKRWCLVFLVIFFFAVPIFAQTVDTSWVRRYNGPGNSGDYARATAVDGSGNVYVTGGSGGIGTSSDYATVKYGPDGTELWVRRYDGPVSGADQAHAIAVDAAGNVYVAGNSAGSGTGQDCATIKYLPNGDTAWVRRYNGVDNGGDWVRAIALDGSGNVFVTGIGYVSGTGDDFITIKYYANGDTAWVRRYNGSGNDTDYGNDIAVDDSGNVYVTGGSDRDPSSSSCDEFATIKYNSNGEVAWVRTYQSHFGCVGGGALAVDDSGNVYVTGISETIKYNSQGYLLWHRDWGGLDIVTDESDNVYVTGWRLVIPTLYDWTTIKYLPNGDTSWVRTYNGPASSFDRAYAIAVDHLGNVYATGDCNGSIGMLGDYATIKYYPNGNTAWVRTYNGPGNYADGGQALAVDDSGNVYVTGYSDGGGTGTDYATIKYVQFLRGDANHDNNVTIADIIYLVSYLFKRGPVPVPIQSGDANCDGKVTIADVVYLVAYLFKGGPPPC